MFESVPNTEDNAIAANAKQNSFLFTFIIVIP
jgi:hypothetical protein